MLPERLTVLEAIWEAEATDQESAQVENMTFEKIGLVYLRGYIPLDHDDADEFPHLCEDVIGMALSEATNNDVCEFVTHCKADLNTKTLRVTVTILDWLS